MLNTKQNKKKKASKRIFGREEQYNRIKQIKKKIMIMMMMAETQYEHYCVF